MTIDEKILGMTTLIKSVFSTYGYSSQGTGFYYSELADEPTGPMNEENGLGWYKVEGEWLITNRHVVFTQVSQPDGTMIEAAPDVFLFFLRETRNGKIEWLPISLTREELIKRTNLHPNPIVDVVAIKVDDLLMDLILNNQTKQIVGAIRLTNRDLPDKSPLKMEATADVIVCSYPYEFYDMENKFPIIKSGIIASSWGANFDGKPYFLVDAHLFPGSSGGLVLSKPIDVAMIDGKLMHAKEKQFVFLGVYSAGYDHTTTDNDGKRHKEPFGLGIVWYANLIPEIINGDVRFSSIIAIK